MAKWKTKINVRRAIARRVPASIVRRAGAWQFRYPLLAPVIRWAARGVQKGETTIQHGLGKGLRFDPAGGYPGYALGTTEPEEQRVLGQYLNSRDVFYDIGANVGFYSTLAARIVGQSGHVYAFEPFAASAAAARANAKRNDFQNVSVIECAVSNANGIGTFLLSGGNVSFKLISTPTVSIGKTVAVPVSTIDEMLQAGKIRPPNVVMLDVEGEELKVLEGMSETISLHRPVILCEVHWIGSDLFRIYQRLLEEQRYRVTQLSGEAPPEGIIRWHALMVPEERACPL